ncbi:MAG: transposase, partial [Geminicoccaceae bacterium]
MPKPYSIDLRERVLQGILDGLKYAQVAERFAVSVSFVSKLLTQWREAGTVEPAKFGGHKTSTLAPHEATVRELLAAEPDLTLAELRQRLQARAILTSRSTLARFLQALGITRKKRRNGRPSR